MNQGTKKDLNKLFIRLVELEYVFHLLGKDAFSIQKDLSERTKANYASYLKPISFWRELKELFLKQK